MPKKKSAKRKPKRTKMMFVQDWGTYDNETIVAVGLGFKEIFTHLKRHKIDPKPSLWLAEQLNKIMGGKPSKQGFILHDGENGWTFLWIREFKDEWDYWETLIHEIVHLVDYELRKHRNMWEEMDACAYQTEYLFRSIRRKIQGADPLE